VGRGDRGTASFDIDAVRKLTRSYMMMLDSRLRGNGEVEYRFNGIAKFI